ncbi:glycosyltransferase [Planctomycetota bacterium]
MKLSIIIPAFNEEKNIVSCLRSVHAAIVAISLPAGDWEIIVCNNNSTDATADLASREGAKVVFEPVNQISRSRNTGAKDAAGDWLLFIDADSILAPESLVELLEKIDTGSYAGGGSLIAFDEGPMGARIAVSIWNFISPLFGWAAGSFVFCRADAFRDVGGFSADLYAAEEVALSRALRKWGKSRHLEFTILKRQRHISSGRKFYLYSTWDFIKILSRFLVTPWRVLKKREHCYHLYDGRR